MDTYEIAILDFIKSKGKSCSQSEIYRRFKGTTPSLIQGALASLVKRKTIELILMGFVQHYALATVQTGWADRAEHILREAEEQIRQARSALAQYREEGKEIHISDARGFVQVAEQGLCQVIDKPVGQSTGNLKNLLMETLAFAEHHAYTEWKPVKEVKEEAERLLKMVDANA